ncbi:hypothetical protein [Microvirga vignae]|uniref:hypothetical protein n=1 Tax=Microvirga vignae TaxID=1225564 RepID=UPI0012372891|nr:hypothetical protein [Microvirga vignae]
MARLLLSSRTDALGQTTVTTYDDLGRPKTKTARADTALAETTTYSYDEARTAFVNGGQLTSVSKPAGTAKYDYDTNGRKVRDTYTVDGTPYTSTLWVRENYRGHNREHMVLQVPRLCRGNWPEPEVADFRRIDDQDEAVSYIVKQLTPQAHYALRIRVRRERHCRYSQSPVAEVLGRRVSMTRDLERLVRRLESVAICAGGSHAR